MGNIDVLSFYIYDAGYIIANTIAWHPFGKGKPDRGQSLLFHEFIQLWLGYEFVKVLVIFWITTHTFKQQFEGLVQRFT